MNLELKKGLKIGAFVVGLIVLFVLSGNILESVDANEICVIQSPGSGERTVYTTAGWKGQWFGTVRKYNKSFQYWFSSAPDEGNQKDSSIPVMFNDGGHGSISGSCRIDLPTDEKSVLLLDEKFKSQDALESQIVRPVIEKAVYLVGPLMSSRESYAEKKNDLIFYIEDQAVYGVYKTVQKEEKIKDQLSGVEKTQTIVEIVKGPDGKIVRNEKSPITENHLKMYSLSINGIHYDTVVMGQIKMQQEAAMSIQLAMSNAKKAEQDAITTELQGKSKAVKAKWDQEVLKATAVTQAEQQKEVARLEKDAAEFTKQKEILLGQGEAERKKLVFTADGALSQKLDAYVRIQETYAKEFAKQKWVPEIIIGGNSEKTTGSSYDQFMNMMNLRAAQELGLELKNKKN